MKLRSSRVVRPGRKPVVPEPVRARLRLRCDRHVHAVAHSFFAQEVRVRGLAVRAAACVDRAALLVAADRLSRQLAGLPRTVVDRLASLDAAVHIIGRGQVTSDLPEHAHMRGVDGGYTGETGVTVDQRTRGMGGLKSSCGEENLLNIDDDPCYGGRDILTHEFAHAVMDFGLPPAVVDAIHAQHRTSVEKGLWIRPGGGKAYAGSNASEYWAELSMWYFGTHGEFVDAANRLPLPGPAGLARYDPEGFRLLGAIYDGTHPGFGQDDIAAPPLQTKIHPLPHDAPASARRSVAGDTEPCELLVRNGSALDADFMWVDAEGVEKQYGRVLAQSSFVQRTFAGHVWHIKPRAPAADGTQDGEAPAVDGAADKLPASVFLCAEKGKCVAEVWCNTATGHCPQTRSHIGGSGRTV